MPKNVSFILYPPLQYNKEHTDVNFMPNLDSYLVPYLTKNQIEAKGWQILNRSDNNYIYAKKDYSELRYDMSHVTLAIYNTIDPTNELIKYPAYYGECRCINDFCQIMKQIKL